jgi:hypothetical protein
MNKVRNRIKKQVSDREKKRIGSVPLQAVSNPFIVLLHSID